MQSLFFVCTLAVASIFPAAQQSLVKNVSSALRSYVHPAQPEQTVQKLLRINRDIISLTASAKILHEIVQRLEIPEISSASDELISFASDESEFMIDLMRDIRAYQEKERLVKEQHSAQTPAQMLALTIAGSTTNTRSLEQHKTTTYSAIAAQTVLADYVLRLLSTKASKQNSMLTKATCFGLVTSSHALLDHYRTHGRFITGLEIGALSSLLPAITGPIKGMAGSLIGLYFVHRFFKWFTSGEEAKQELLAQRIENRYKEFCDRYKRTVEQLEQKLETVQQKSSVLSKDMNQLQGSLTSLSASSHKHIDQLSQEIERLHQEMSQAAHSHTAEKKQIIDQMELKITKLQDMVTSVQDHGVGTLQQVSQQLTELKATVAQAKERTDLIAAKLNQEALPKMAQIMETFRTFAAQEQSKLATIIKCLATNKEMRKILERAEPQKGSNSTH